MTATIDRKALARCVIWMLTAGLALSACTTVPSPPAYYTTPVPPAAGSRLSSQIATASWYGAERGGHLTSNGEAFNPNGLTAASKSLPMGSRVRVTDVANGRSVVVRINDRGPFVKGRSIDLSRAAAERIGLANKGVGRVQIAGLDRGRAEPDPAVSRVSYAAMMGESFESPSRTAHPAAKVSGHRHPRRARARYYRHTVSNPITRWLLSALPRF